MSALRYTNLPTTGHLTMKITDKMQDQVRRSIQLDRLKEIRRTRNALALTYVLSMAVLVASSVAIFPLF